MCACVRVVIYQLQVTCVAALEDLSQLAIGLCNGLVILLYDLAHERVPKQTILAASVETPITGNVKYKNKTNIFFDKKN